MRVRENLKSLSGPEKAAVFILSLSEEQASAIFELLEDDEIKELSQVMASLGTVSSGLIETLHVSFSEQISSRGNVIGSYDSTERLLNKVLGEDRVSQIMEEIRGPAGRTMWDKLGNVNEEVLAAYLRNEYPQTVAVVLSKVRPEHAAKVLGKLPDALSVEVINRMLGMETVQKEILSDIESTLRTEFMNNLARTNKQDPHEQMADIFNFFDRNTEEKFMKSLGKMNPVSTEKIQALMFTFEDLKSLDGPNVQTLLRFVDKDKLILALKGASDAIKELFFSNMSERAGKIMKEDMESMGPVKLKDVDEAQMSVVTVAKDMADRGELTLATQGEEELVY